MKKRKIKLMIISAVCCMAMAVPVMAATLRSFPYSISAGNANQFIGEYYFGYNGSAYLDTRPTSGGDVTITLSGGAIGSATFPYSTSRSPWKVSVTKDIKTTVVGKASAGATGTLAIRDTP